MSPLLQACIATSLWGDAPAVKGEQHPCRLTRERGLQACLGIDVGDDGEGNSVGDEGQRRHETCEQVVSGIGKPVLAERV